MKSVILSLVLMQILLACLASAASMQPGKSPRDFQTVGPAAIWNPDQAAMRAIRQKCSPLSPPEFGACFISGMKDSGASPEAVAFAKSMEDPAFLRAFRKVGPVDVAYVTYPFRANQNEACLLVNGNPPRVDIDALQTLPQEEMKRDPVYRELVAKSPEALLFAGDRYETDYPTVENLNSGGNRFIASYDLKNRCRACELLGIVKFGFDFDAKGTFLGAKFLRITKAAGLNLR